MPRAAMTLDIYADLFDDDLEAVAIALHEARARRKCGQNVGTGWAADPTIGRPGDEPGPLIGR